MIKKIYLQNKLLFQSFWIPLIILLFVFIFSWLASKVFSSSNTYINTSIKKVLFLWNSYQRFTDANNNIEVVEIDDKSYNSLWFPLSRLDYIPVIENLNKLWAAVVWIDILFMDKWKDKDIDNSLAEAFKKSWNIVIWADIKSNTFYLDPYYLFKKSVKNIGYFQPYIDPDNWEAIWIEAIKNFKWVNKEHFSITVFKEFLWSWDSKIKIKDKWNYDILWEKIPFIEKYDYKSWKKYQVFKINYVNPNKFNRSSFIDIYKYNLENKEKELIQILENIKSKKDNEIIDKIYEKVKDKKDFLYSKEKLEYILNSIKNIKNPEIDIENDISKLKEILKNSYKQILKYNNKIILIWYTAEWVKDDFQVPELWIIKWVYIHANSINNILNKTYTSYYNKIFEIIIIYLILVIIIYFILKYIKKWITKLIILSVWVIFITIIIYWIILYSFLETQSIIKLTNYPSELLFSMILTIFSASLIKYTHEYKNKDKLVKALSDYVSEDIAKEILSWAWKIKLDWERKKISIFFSDIAGFTGISEKLEPEDLVLFLREYLWEMSDIIMDERWTIDKFEWDAIMALWWCFWYEKEKSYDACISALKQQEKLKELNKKWIKQWLNKIWVRIWLHTWEAIIWDIWAKWKKKNYTALGDSVNLASRLEWVNKFYETSICVSEDLYEEVKDSFVFRYLDKIKVKWKQEAKNIYELVWVKWEVSKEKEDLIKDFEKALNYYFAWEFKIAKSLFHHLSVMWDNTSNIFYQRCEKLSIKYNAKTNNKKWDWIWEMKEK